MVDWFKQVWQFRQKLYLPVAVKGFIWRHIATVGLLIELMAGVSYCTELANWQRGRHLPETPETTVVNLLLLLLQHN